MEEHTAVTPTPEANATPSPEPTGAADMAAHATHDEEAAPPRGAFVFVMVMLVGYFFYWFATWFVVFVERGGG